MKKILLVLVITLTTLGFVWADHYVKMKVHTDPISMMGQNQPAKDEISETWIGNNLFANHSPERSFIVDLNKQMMYTINHNNKTYIEIKLPFNAMDYYPEQMRQMMEGMMGSMKVTVTPTGKTKQIQQWNCDEYDVEMSIMMMNMKMKYWATKDVPFDWKMVSEKMMDNMKKLSMRLSDEVMAEFRKIEGFQIASEMNMNVMGGNVRTTTETLEISEKSPAANVYSLPAGYTKQDKFSMEDMRQ
ncbi:MAG: DUF4412 domain-containing protein [Acidobacteria bacterium]|nr:DUF4412 domain-containing protein [Acidobacteriota bacterium]